MESKVYIFIWKFFFNIFIILILNDIYIYIHQLFSFGVISFTLLIIIIYLILKLEEHIILNVIWYYFINSLLYGLYDVLGKKYMNLYFDWNNSDENKFYKSFFLFFLYQKFWNFFIILEFG